MWVLTTKRTERIGIKDAFYFDQGRTILIFLPLEITDFEAVVDARSAEAARETFALGVHMSNGTSLVESKSENFTIGRNERQKYFINLSSGHIEISRVTGPEPPFWVRNWYFLALAAVTSVLGVIIIRRRKLKKRHS